jgi:hypothetical protein
MYITEQKFRYCLCFNITSESTAIQQEYRQCMLQGKDVKFPVVYITEEEELERFKISQKKN